jgi:3-methyl-2-oxobutanoate hydroxymethyltransferase
MGHLGLTPQSIYKFGTYSVRAKEDEEANKLIEDAKVLEAAGCFAVVLEKIPRELAKRVSEAIDIPTIGIGAGPDCDGQVLVLHDLLGITMDFSPRFLRRYLNLADEIDGAIKQYCDDVRQGEFPNESESYTS